MKKAVLVLSVLLMVTALTVTVEAKKDKTAAGKTGKAGKKGGGKKNKGSSSSTSTYTPSTGNSWSTATSPTLEGKILKAADDKGTLSVLPKCKYDAEKDSVKVETNASTVVTIDGVDGKLADIKPDMTLTVTPDIGVATKIEAKTAK